MRAATPWYLEGQDVRMTIYFTALAVHMCLNHLNTAQTRRQKAHQLQVTWSPSTPP